MERYHFGLEGPILEDNVPLHIAVDSLSNFQAIVDRTYLELKGEKKRLSKKERKFFQLRAYSFEKGSFTTYFEIFLQLANLYYRSCPH